MADVLVGTVKSLVFRNEDTGYFVARVSGSNRKEQVMIGNTPVIQPGERVEASGEWVNSPYGVQFKAAKLTLSPPTMADGILRYLSSGAVEGIGKVMAQRLVDAFGDATFNVIDSAPEQLYLVQGVGKKRVDSILSNWKEQKSVRAVMTFLHQNGLTTGKANKIYARYGEQAVNLIKANPYRLCKDIYGIGFKSADAVARSLGIPQDAEFRIRAGLSHVLQEAQAEGSCGLPWSALRDRSRELLLVPEVLIQEAIDAEVKEGSLLSDFVSDEMCVFIPKIYYEEMRIANVVKRLARAKHPALSLRADKVVADILVEKEIELADEQAEAVSMGLTCNISVLTGPPGSGKTTVIDTIAEALERLGLSVTLCAPTGKAAKRLSESTGRPAKTIHRLLKVRISKGGPTFEHDKDNPLPYDYIIVDEFSMVDVPLAYHLLNALGKNARILIVGDVDQLPSVGPGRVLADLIDSRRIPVTRLTKIFRQQGKSKIVANAIRINRGEAPEMVHNPAWDYEFIGFRKPSKDDVSALNKAIQRHLLERVRESWKLGFDPVKDVQVLAPMKRGELGVDTLNVLLQKMLNPRPTHGIERYGMTLSVGDKVIQNVNNYRKDVYNGDIGYVKSIDKAASTLIVTFDDRDVDYKFTELDELKLAYALTIHRCQGSEAPMVVMALTMSHYVMLKRNLLYTGITRAKNKLVLLAEPSAVQAAVQSSQTDERYSRLKEFIESPLDVLDKDVVIPETLDES